MIKLDNGKVYRNLQEQVRKNQSDILDVTSLTNILGIKVVGQVDKETELPNPSTYEGTYGDAYAVGTNNNYQYYVYTRPNEAIDSNHWFNIGQIKGAKGEQGQAGKGIQSIIEIGTDESKTTYQIQYTDGSTFSYEVYNGKQGEQGVRGSMIWYGTIPAPSLTRMYDMLLDENGSVWRVTKNGTSQVEYFTNIKGANGQDGKASVPYQIVGILESASLLPEANKDNQQYAYLVGSENNYALYCIVGSDSNGYIWANCGSMTSNNPTQQQQLYRHEITLTGLNDRPSDAMCDYNVSIPYKITIICTNEEPISELFGSSNDLYEHLRNDIFVNCTLLNCVRDTEEQPNNCYMFYFNVYRIELIDTETGHIRFYYNGFSYEAVTLNEINYRYMDVMLSDLLKYDIGISDNVTPII